MIRPLILCCAILFCLTTCCYAQDEAAPLSRIAFGSCARQYDPQPIWDTIIAAQPDLFLFIGDNIYGDTDDMQVLKQKWNQLGTIPGYQKLKATCPIQATWDDHDYGRNDAGYEYEMKNESQQIFLDFFDVPQDSPRRTHHGVYGSSTTGPVGQRVQVILLDTRFNRSPLVKRTTEYEQGEGDRGPYARVLDPGATVLGDTQWKWLEDQLRVPAEIRIVASSIQLVADGHCWEKWGNFPLERYRFMELVRETRANGVIIISGDRHSAEISMIEEGLHYPLLDITSSSLNAPNKWHTEANPHRQGTKYIEENFGLIVIDWEASDPVIRAQVRGLDGEVKLQHRVRLSQLQP